MKTKGKPITELQKKKMIKLIHAQKTRAEIDDETYRIILMETAGVQSSLDMKTMSQFTGVTTALNNLLIAQGKTPFNSTTPRIPRDVYPLVKRAERILGADADARLGGHVRKLGKESVNDLSPNEIRKCHAFLTRIAQREGK